MSWSSTTQRSSPMRNSGSIPPPSNSPFDRQEINDPFGNSYTEGGAAYTVDLTQPPQVRLGRLTRQPNTKLQSREGNAHREELQLVAEEVPNRAIYATSEDGNSETLSDFLNSDSAPSQPSQEEPQLTPEKHALTVESPSGIRIMSFEQLELPSEPSSSEVASDLEQPHISVTEEPPVEEELAGPIAKAGLDHSENDAQQTESIEPDRDVTTDEAVPGSHSVDISYADEDFEEESSLFVPDDDKPRPSSGGPMDTSNPRLSSSTSVQTEQYIAAPQTPRSSPRRRPLVRTCVEQGVQVDGLPQSIGTQCEQPSSEKHIVCHCYGHQPFALDSWSNFPAVPPPPPVSHTAPLEMVNELLDEAFKEQVALLRAAASQQREALLRLSSRI